MGPLELVLSRLERVRKQGASYYARCPAHEDRNPSLRVRQGEDGVLVRCWAGCSTESVLEAMGLMWRDLFDSENSSPRAKNTVPKRPKRSSDDRPPQLGIEVGPAGYSDPLLAQGYFNRTAVEYDENGEITFYRLRDMS